RQDGTLVAVSGPDMVVLRTPVAVHGADRKTLGTFTVSAADSVPFVLTYGPSHLDAPGPIDPSAALVQTEAFWRDWSSRFEPTDEWAEPVLRSLITLKALTYQPTGAIVAAPTTSLPEQLGGPRNWDYRYTWIRDAAFSLYGLLRLGFTEEAAAFMEWLTERFRERRGADATGPLQTMYGIDGRHELPEETLYHFEGYRGSGPVRIGNAAADQLQLDIYGELIDSVYLYNKYGAPIYHE